MPRSTGMSAVGMTAVRQTKPRHAAASIACVVFPAWDKCKPDAGGKK